MELCWQIKQDIDNITEPVDILPHIYILVHFFIIKMWLIIFKLFVLPLTITISYDLARE